MGVSVLRVAACAGVLVGGLILGDSAAGIAFAEPGAGDLQHSDEQFSKDVNNEHPSLSRVIHRILSEHRKRLGITARSAQRAKIGSEPDSSFIASEPTVSTFADTTEEPAPEPELAPDNERAAEPTGSDSDAGDVGVDPAGTEQVGADAGSDYTDNTVVTDNPVVAADPAPAKQQVDIDVVEYPFLYYVLEVRREGGGWWNATIIISRRQAETSQPAPEPEPEIAPAPAFRGPAPEAPAPEPVLDASGGVSGGSDYQATGFGGAPVLSAPIVAVPVPPPAAVRFPAFPPAATPAPGLGSAARAWSGAPGSTVDGGRAAGAHEQAPTGTVRAMSGQTPRQGYTDYLRSPGLPQLAGAALPGVAGILLMTLGGGIIGYRQADAGRMIRSSGAARYLP